MTAFTQDERLRNRQEFSGSFLFDGVCCFYGCLGGCLLGGVLKPYTMSSIEIEM